MIYITYLEKSETNSSLKIRYQYMHISKLNNYYVHHLHLSNNGRKIKGLTKSSISFLKKIVESSREAAIALGELKIEYQNNA